MDIHTLTEQQFKQLPLVVEGESKEVRYAGNGEVIIRLKPTVYSFTHNRTGVLPGTDTLRLQSIQKLLPVLRAAGIEHTYIEVNDKWIRSKLVLQPHVAGQPAPFVPDDLSAEQLAQLPKAPPVEVVAKAVHSGTPKHRYYQMDAYKTRDGATIAADVHYPAPFIRFDWRNPMFSEDGTRLADEVLPEPMADWYMDATKATATAQKAYNALQKHVQTKGLDLWDICFFIAEDGTTMFGEVSPDCLRVRARDGSALDKDVWRHGGSSAAVAEKWAAFASLV